LPALLSQNKDPNSVLYQNHWLAVVAGDGAGAFAPYSNICGADKYWCATSAQNGVAPDYSTKNGTFAPGPNNPAQSSVSDLTAGGGGGGTSEASAQALGSLALVMARFPYMTNDQARDVLLTSAQQYTGYIGVSPVTGFGEINLQNAMNGPGQFLGAENINMPRGMIDAWSNNISEAAIKQRVQDLNYETQLSGSTTFQNSEISKAQALLNAASVALANSGAGSTAYVTAMAAVQANRIASIAFQMSVGITSNSYEEFPPDPADVFPNVTSGVLNNAMQTVIGELPADQAWLQSFNGGPIVGSLTLSGAAR
jgi:hypothetical protein